METIKKIKDIREMMIVDKTRTGRVARFESKLIKLTKKLDLYIEKLKEEINDLKKKENIYDENIEILPPLEQPSYYFDL